MFQLIENWKKSWKFSSMWWSGLGFLIGAADQILGVVPLAQLHSVPHGKSIMWVLFGLTMIGRIMKMKDSSDGRTET